MRARLVGRCGAAVLGAVARNLQVLRRKPRPAGASAREAAHARAQGAKAQERGNALSQLFFAIRQLLIRLHRLRLAVAILVRHAYERRRASGHRGCGGTAHERCGARAHRLARTAPPRPRSPASTASATRWTCGAAPVSAQSHAPPFGALRRAKETREARKPRRSAHALLVRLLHQRIGVRHGAGAQRRVKREAPPA